AQPMQYLRCLRSFLRWYFLYLKLLSHINGRKKKIAVCRDGYWSKTTEGGQIRLEPCLIGRTKKQKEIQRRPGGPARPKSRAGLRILLEVAAQLVDRGKTQRALRQLRLDRTVDIERVAHAVDDAGLEDRDRARFRHLRFGAFAGGGFARDRVG